MRIADNFRKNSVFLGTWTAGSFVASATAFLVIVEDGTSIDGSYLVTAGHVARELKDVPFEIRLNKSDGTSDLDHIDKMEWRFHDRFPEVDVAIAHYVPPDWADCTYLSSNDFTSSRHFTQQAEAGIISEDIFWDIGAGDAVYVIGLFNLLPGVDRNAQFVHNGRIALMPGDERIPITDRQTGKRIYCEGYLVEIHTLPGASGSPAVVRGTVAFKAAQAKTGDEFIAYAHTRAFLLGVYQGAWEGPPSDLFKASRGTDATRVPMGVGIVAPAVRIMETLMYDDVVDARFARADRRGGISAAVQDSAFPTRPTTPDNPEHREAFNSLLNAAAKKRPPAD